MKPTIDWTIPFFSFFPLKFSTKPDELLVRIINMYIDHLSQNYYIDTNKKPKDKSD